MLYVVLPNWSNSIGFYRVLFSFERAPLTVDWGVFNFTLTRHFPRFRSGSRFTTNKLAHLLIRMSTRLSKWMNEWMRKGAKFVSRRPLGRSTVVFSFFFCCRCLLSTSFPVTRISSSAKVKLGSWDLNGKQPNRFFAQETRRRGHNQTAIADVTSREWKCRAKTRKKRAENERWDGVGTAILSEPRPWTRDEYFRYRRRCRFGAESAWPRRREISTGNKIERQRLRLHAPKSQIPSSSISQLAKKQRAHWLPTGCKLLLLLLLFFGQAEPLGSFYWYYYDSWTGYVEYSFNINKRHEPMKYLSIDPEWNRINRSA